MSYWHGKARQYSRKVEAAYEAVKAAEKALLDTLAAEYPPFLPSRKARKGPIKAAQDTPA